MRRSGSGSFGLSGLYGIAATSELDMFLSDSDFRKRMLLWMVMNPNSGLYPLLKGL
jgi:hypothetical protein